MVSKLLNALRKCKYDLYVVVIIAILFSILWYYADLLRLLSFNAYLYDLGTQTASLISLSHTSSLQSFLIQITPTKPGMILFVPLVYIFPTPKTLLFIQAFSIGFSAVPLYSIAKEYSRRVDISAIIITAYLLFFPLNRLVYFDFHFMALFPLPFFIGYYLYLKGSKWFLLFFFLASLFDIALAVAPVLIILSGIFGYVRNRVNVKKSNISTWKGFSLFIYTLSLFTLSFVFIFYIYMTSFGSFINFNTTSSSSIGLIPSYINNARNALKYGTPILFLSIIPLVPLLFSPVRNWKIGYIMAPFILMFFLSGYPFWLFNAQYMGGFLSPLLFILVSALFRDGIDSDPKSKEKKMKGIRQHVFLIVQKRRTINTEIAIVFLTLVLLISLYYAPWGPLNSSSPSALGSEYNSFANFHEEVTLTNTEKIADKMFSLVPANKTVLMQDNMPILSGRVRNYMFGPGLLPWLNSTGVSYSPGPTPHSNVPEYIALDTESWFTNWFYNSTDGTMQYWFTYFYEHYHYGLLGYDYPFALYELNYTGKPIVMNNANIPVKEVLNLTYPFDTNHTTYPVVFEPFLFPGKYSAYFNITIGTFENLSSNNQINFTISNISNSGEAYVFKITDFNESDIGKNLSISLNFTISSPAFIIYYMNPYNFRGSVLFRGGGIYYICQ